MKFLRHTTYTILILLTILWLFSPPLLGIIAEKQLHAHLPAIKHQLATQGLELNLLTYQRAWWQSHSQWQIKQNGQALNHITLELQHGIFSSAGLNILRIQAHTTPQDHWQIPLQLTLRLSPRAQLIATLHSHYQQNNLSAQAQLSLWQHDTLTIQAENSAQRATFPPFQLNAHIHFPTTQHQQQRLAPPIRFLLNHTITLQAQLEIYPQQAHSQLHVTLHLQEQLDNPLQLLALRQRDSLITLLEHSHLSIQIPNTHTNPQAILDFLAQPPLLLQGKFTPQGTQLHSAWHITQGKIQALSP